MAGAVHLANQQDKSGSPTCSSRLAGRLQTAIFVCLAAVALCAPISTKGAVNAFRAAAVFWLIALCTRRVKLKAQPLALPLVLFLLLTAISSAFSIDPLLSWGRMRTVSLLFLAIVTGQALRSMRQLKILSTLLIGSCLVTVVYTGWQYTAGIGVRASGDGASVSSLRRLGLAPGDIIRKVGGMSVRSGHDLDNMSPSGPMEVLVWRETPNALQPFHLKVDSRAWHAALKNPGLTLVRAHPPRAQGFFKHYFPFSEILVFVGSLLWGFSLSGVRDQKLRIALLAAFGVTAITLALTLTRISLVSLAAGAFLIILMQGTWRSRWRSIAVFLVIGFVGIYWVQSHRGAPESDPGTQYRLLMWRDSVGMMRAHPVFGVGLDAIAGDWQRWNLEAYRRFGLHSHFHSTPIQIAVECGLPALAVWIWLLAGYAIFLARQRLVLAKGDCFSRGLLLGGLSVLVGFVITGFLQYNFGDAEAMVVFWLVMGMTFAAARLKSEGGSRAGSGLSS
jgi:O-antigen ligase